jgi:hypothetical protein
MARKRTSDEGDTLLWYRLECFRRSRFYEWLRGKLKESGKTEEVASRIEAVARFREYVLSAPVLPMASDWLSWMTVKIALDCPPSVVLASLASMLKEIRNRDESQVWIDILLDYGEAVEAIMREEPRSALGRLADRTRPFRRRKERVHLKDLRLRLDVWDRVQKGAPFARLARHFKRPATTVRDLYEKAALDICGSLPPRHRRKRQLQTFDPATHTRACPQCSKAEEYSDFCPRWKAYVNQDYKSLRELPSRGQDVTSSTDDDASEAHTSRRRRHRGAE